ncbi:MAG: ribbon-helix-helix protein, CopG family [Candidatus Scatomorpha sp.]|jgi:metal-responsive CopG/Arc/MetJ family transcriptional regulator
MPDDELILRPKRLKGDDGYKTFSVRVKEDVVAKLDEIARRTGRSRNELVGIFLDYAVEHCRIED